jgi:hypothetical protein
VARRSCCACVAGALVLGAPAIVSAAEAQDSPRVTLTWTAPDGCPPAARVVAEVDRLLGGATAPRRPPLVVTATVAADAAGVLRVHIEAPETDGSGSGPRVRELHAASCEALADATATILALMIDPDRVVAAAPAVAAPPPTPPVVAPQDERPLPAPSSRFAPRVRFDASAVADVGTLPGAGFGAAGSAVLTLAALQLELGFTGLPSRSAHLAARPTAGGDVSLLAGTAAACWNALPKGIFELAPCLGWEVGDLRASGFGVTSPGSGDTLWSAARTGARFAWSPLARLAFFLRAEAIVPVTRPTFVLQSVGAVFRPGPAAGRAGLGIELRL